MLSVMVEHAIDQIAVQPITVLLFLHPTLAAQLIPPIPPKMHWYFPITAKLYGTSMSLYTPHNP